MNLNKVRSTGVQVNDAITVIDRIDPHKDGTSTVTVRFFESQEVIDTDGPHFDQKDYVIDTPVNFKNQINAELKKLVDFDQAV